MTASRYELVVAPSVRRQLAHGLSDSVAGAAYGFITGPLCTDPYRAGGRLRPPLDDRYSARRGTYRVIYRIDAPQRRVTVVGVFSRADAYRPRIDRSQ
ncbi:MAG: type II toxin-antitoxin system RelE/ParE family toxin [Actinomycetota bacterium]|nr:type II toxin-antitoxin system RelE/ParE family toxin [Actinomycetota bacterium]